MNWYIVFYLFSLADKIEATMQIISIIGTGAIIVFGFIWMGCVANVDSYTPYTNTIKISKRIFTIILPSTIISWFLWAVVPDRQDMLLIIAGGAVGEFVTNDENAKQLPADITKFLRKEILDATLEDGNEVLKDAIGIKSERDKLLEMTKEELVDLLEDKTEGK